MFPSSLLLVVEGVGGGGESRKTMTGSETDRGLVG